MRIAYIGQKGIPAKIGGVERYVDEVAARMARDGHDVFVYVRNHYTPKRMKNYKEVNLIHLPTIKTKHLDAITHTFLSTIHALFQNYDVIHYHSLGPTSLSFIPKIFSRGTAIIATYQSQDYEHEKWGAAARKYLKLGEFITFNIPDKIISVAPVLKNYGLSHYGKDSVLIPNGMTLFKKVSTLAAFRKWKLGKKKYILCVSRLVKHKEVHILIEAFINLKAMKRVKSEFKLVIVGGGAYTDDYVKELKKMVRGRKDIILAGVQKRDKLAALYSNAYCYVQPSRSEGLSLALLEAMGAGLAPIVSDIPENTSVIEKNGYVFRVGDVFDLMSKIEYCIGNPKKVKLIGKEARKMVKEKYNWDNIVRDICQVYKEAVNGKKSSVVLRKTNLAGSSRWGIWM